MKKLSSDGKKKQKKLNEGNKKGTVEMHKDDLGGDLLYGKKNVRKEKKMSKKNG